MQGIGFYGIGFRVLGFRISGLGLGSRLGGLRSMA